MMETQSIHAQGYGPPGGGGYGGPPGGGYGGPPPGGGGYGGPPGGGGYGGPPGGMPPGGGGFGPPPGGGYGAPPPGGYGGGGYGPPGPQGFGPQGFGPGGPMMPGAGGDVNTTLPLVLSILMIFPCCNLLFGIAALVFAIQAGNAKKVGDFQTARSKAKVSYIIMAIGFVLTIVVGIVQAALNN